MGKPGKPQGLPKFGSKLGTLVCIKTFGIVDRQGQWSAYHNQGNQNTSNIEYSHFNWNGNEWILNKRYQQHVIKLTIFIF